MRKIDIGKWFRIRAFATPECLSALAITHALFKSSRDHWMCQPNQNELENITSSVRSKNQYGRLNQSLEVSQNCLWMKYKHMCAWEVLSAVEQTQARHTLSINSREMASTLNFILSVGCQTIFRSNDISSFLPFNNALTPTVKQSLRTIEVNKNEKKNKGVNNEQHVQSV